MFVLPRDGRRGRGTFFRDAKACDLMGIGGLAFC